MDWNKAVVWCHAATLETEYIQRCAIVERAFKMHETLAGGVLRIEDDSWTWA